MVAILILLKQKALIAEKTNNPQSKIYFVSGGTQANLLALGAMLRPYESVITCENLSYLR